MEKDLYGSGERSKGVEKNVDSESNGVIMEQAEVDTCWHYITKTLP